MNHAFTLKDENVDCRYLIDIVVPVIQTRQLHIVLMQ